MAAEDTPAAPAKSTVMEGPLLKRGSVSWRARYFVLTADRFAYFAREGETKSRGYIDLKAESMLFDFPKRPFSFQVVTDDKSLTVSASCEAECDKWVAAVQNCLAAVRRNEQRRQSRPKSDSSSSKTFNVTTAAGQEFEMSARYQMIKPIGHGAYGVVVSATDAKRGGGKVAIKKIPNAFEDLVDAKRILREIRLLRHMKHNNVISVLDLFVPHLDGTDFNDIYIVSELMETDLHRVIYSRQQLSIEHVQFFLYQILCALKYIHSASVLHRDLKPSNVLLNANCDLKLCDFGLSRGLLDDEHGANLTEYVVTRWYRAPEIMLSCEDYGCGIDVWSIACIFAEMLGRQPLFPGSDYIHQLKLIMKVVGTPSEAELGFVNNTKARRFVLNLTKYPREPLNKLFPQAPAEGLDLLDRMLQLDPAQRISVSDALAHPFLANVADPACEIEAGASINLSDIETCELSKDNLQRLLLNDLRAVQALQPAHPPAAPEAGESDPADPAPTPAR